MRTTSNSKPTRRKVETTHGNSVIRKGIFGELCLCPEGTLKKKKKRPFYGQHFYIPLSEQFLVPSEIKL